MNECLTTPQHEKEIGYWVSEKGKCMKWLYSHSERGNPQPPHGLLFPISSKGSFIFLFFYFQYHSLCYTSCGALAGTRNSSVGPP